jgi:type IV pilus assembly protein PilE
MNRTKRKDTGMTLIELMIALLIIGILSAISIPAYRTYVLRANRADAKRALLARASDLERCFTVNNSYLDNPPNAPCGVTANLPDLTMNTYRIEPDPTANPAGIQATTFAIRAVPINAQVKDTKCGTFKLDDKNNRSVTGTSTAQDCWNR